MNAINPQNVFTEEEKSKKPCVYELLENEMLQIRYDQKKADARVIRSDWVIALWLTKTSSLSCLATAKFLLTT